MGWFQILKSITRPILVYSTVQNVCQHLFETGRKTTLASFFVLDFFVFDPDEGNSVVGSLPHYTVNMRRMSLQDVFAYRHNNLLWRPHTAS